MAATNKPLTSKQQASAERIAGYGAEQQRLKAAAAARRAAAAKSEPVERGRWATPERSGSVAPRAKYLG
jgi:hypothetical protein